MKILRISGENIASLIGPFEVDLSQGPLADAGLFAICGATGAGKSTLLDCICLALFDTTPRLMSRGGAAVGRADQEEADRMRSNDVRGLLSRGTGSGFAEVDFRGVDNLRYRARWDVRRSRNRPTGRLQKVVMSLTDLATEATHGDKKTEVLAEISSRLCLTFEQFKRSAMLAQGDFAAFLHADERERADLLERVTGTAIYTQISKASYQRTATEQRLYDELVAKAKQLGRLTPTDRQVLDEQIATASVALRAAEDRAASAKDVASWFEVRKRLEALVTQGQAAITQATTRRDAAHDRRARIQQIAAIAPVRLPLQRRDDAITARDGARDTIAATEARKMSADAKHLAASELVADAKGHHANTVAALQKAEPIIEAAQALDTRLQEAQRTHTMHHTALDKAVSSAQRLQQASQAATSEVDSTEQRAKHAKEWLTAHPGAAALAGAFQPLRSALLSLDAALGAANTLAAQTDTLRAASDAANKASETKQREDTQARTAVDQTTIELAAANSRVIPTARGLLDARRDSNDRARERLAALTRAHLHAQDAQNQLNEAHTERDQLTLQADQATVASSEATALREQLGAQLDEAQRHFQTVLSAMSASEHRANLVDGEPCSVCGATEHPYAQQGALSELHRTSETRVKELRDAYATCDGRLSKVTTALATLNGKLAALNKLVSAAKRAMAAAQDSWTAARDHQDDVPALPTHDDCDTALHSLTEAANVERQAIAQQNEELTELEHALTVARTTHDAALAAHERARTALSTAQQAARHAKSQLQEHEATLASAKRDQEAARATAAQILTGRTGWEQTAPSQLLSILSAEVQAFSTHNTTATQAEAQLRDLLPKAAQARANATTAQQAATEAQATTTNSEELLAKLRAKRAPLLDGRPANEVATELRSARDRADIAVAKAQQALQQVTAEQAAAEQAAKSAVAELRKTTDALELRQRELRTALAEFQLDEASAVALLSLSADDVKAEQTALSALDEALSKATSTLR